MSVKRYRLYCEICNWSRYTDGSDVANLTQLATSPIPGGSPKFDFETKKWVKSKSTKQTKKFKCPKCGRVVTAKLMDDTIHDEKDRFNGNETSPERPEVQGQSPSGTQG